MNLPCGKLSVNFLSHNDHLASDLFLRIFIAGKLALNVAVGTFHPERTAELPHHLADIYGLLQDFQILRRSGSALLSVRCLCAKRHKS